MATCCSICLEPFQSTTSTTSTSSSTSSSTISSTSSSTATTINRVPRMLWCGHTFCTHCLSQLIPSSTLSTMETQIQCPIDRKITTLHPSDNKSTSMVEELPINRAVMDMLSTLSAPIPSPSSPSPTPLKCHECEQADAVLHCEDCKLNYCQACDEKAHLLKAFRSHKRTSPPLPSSSSLIPSTPTLPTSSSNVCQEHGPILEYCLTCQMPVCGSCIRYGSQDGEVEYDEHKLNLIVKAASTTRQSLETIQQSSKVSFI